MRIKTFILILSLFWSLSSFGQVKDPVISKDFNGYYFKTFCDSLENSSGIRFYFKESEIDSVWIHQTKVPQNLSEILKRTLATENINYLIRLPNVFITSEVLADPRLFTVLDNISEQSSDTSSTQEEETSAENISNAGNTIIHIGKSNGNGKVGLASISGSIRHASSGEPLIGVVVYLEDVKLGTITNAEGTFILKAPLGQHIMSIHSLGMVDQKINIMVHSSGSLFIEMQEEITSLREVTVKGEKGHNITGTQIGLQKLEMKEIKQIPTMMGEVDLIKAALLLPGVQTVGEGASGFNVRGGSTDQNLILLNNAPVFNSSHLFGFFSAFNPDVIRNFSLYKSGIPVQYGGRISSVFDIRSRNGNRKEFSGSGGLSPVTGRITVEGPIVKNKSSFLLGGRTTYSDWLLGRIKDPEIRNSKASFYDFNARINAELNEKNSIEWNIYHSEDKFKFNQDTSYLYSNSSSSLIWTRQLTKNLLCNLSGIYSSYAYQVEGAPQTMNHYKMAYQINYYEFKLDFQSFAGYKHKIQYGLNSVYYNLLPGKITRGSSASLVRNQELNNQNAYESAFYIGDEFDINSWMSVNAGIRYTAFFNQGPDKILKYKEGFPREVHSITDTLNYTGLNIYNWNNFLDPRISFRIRLNNWNSIKLSYNRMHQFLHMMSNSTAMSPTDIWVLSNPNLKPQTGDQYAMGYYHDSKSGLFEFSAEIYYKNLNNIIEYRGGAKLLMNDRLEMDLINAEGKAYGLEWMARKKEGRLNGWLSYVYARTMVRTTSSFKEDQINHGKWFPSNFDKPNTVNAVLNYKFSRRFSTSGSFTWSTGRPITFPVARFSIRDYTLLHYSERNKYRIPDYIRYDFSATLDGNLKARKLAHSSWTFSVYNLMGRDNVYSIFFISTGKDLRGYKLSIFAKPIVTLTWNFKF